MNIPKVFFQAVDEKNIGELPKIALKLLKVLIEKNNIKLEKEIPLKVHPGEPGNISYVKPENYHDVINYLLGKK